MNGKNSSSNNKKEGRKSDRKIQRSDTDADSVYNIHINIGKDIEKRSGQKGNKISLMN